MLPNAFIGKAEQPTESDLELELGPAKALWDELVATLATEHGVTTQDWNSYSRKAGWALRLQKNKRNIVYLSPGHGGFTASFTLGAKALEVARASKLPAHVLHVLDTATKYAEGTAVRLDIENPADIVTVKKLAVAKIAH